MGGTKVFLDQNSDLFSNSNSYPVIVVLIWFCAETDTIRHFYYLRDYNPPIVARAMLQKTDKKTYPICINT